jgi:hypothetical protein
MRLLPGFAGGLAVLGLGVAGLTGCTTSSTSSGLPALPTAGASTPAPLSTTVPRAAISTAAAAAPVSPERREGARAAAAQALGLYAEGQFAAFWKLLSAATKTRISSDTWVSVHQACPSAVNGKPVTVKAITVFGDAAIVTEAVTGASSPTTEVVFNYVNGEWSYSPANPSVYGHGSVTADIAAAKAAGLCGSWKFF